MIKGKKVSGSGATYILKNLLTLPSRRCELCEKNRLDLRDNSVSCLSSLAKYSVFCCFYKEFVRKLKFPNKSIKQYNFV